MSLNDPSSVPLGYEVRVSAFKENVITQDDFKMKIESEAEPTDIFASEGSPIYIFSYFVHVKPEFQEKQPINFKAAEEMVPANYTVPTNGYGFKAGLSMIERFPASVPVHAYDTRYAAVG